MKLIKRYKWSQVALLYDDNFSLKSLQPLLDLTATSDGGFMIVTRQLTLHKREGYRWLQRQSNVQLDNNLICRPVLKELADIQARHIVLACRREILWEVLNQAQQVGKASSRVISSN